jgi:hypothetical protein
MTQAGIAISPKQRDALYAVLRAELGALDDLQTALQAPQPDLEYLYRHGRRLSCFLRLIVDGLGWGNSIPGRPVYLKIPSEELRSILVWVREATVSASGGLGIEEAGQGELDALAMARNVCDEILEQM